MRSHKLKTALLVSAGAVLATAAAPASASVISTPSAPSPSGSAPTSASAQSPSSAHRVVVDCFSKPHVRPSTYLIACGDGNNGLVSLVWSTWGSASAVGRGTDVVNDCQPYCAAGKFHNYPVVVRLDRAAPLKGHPQQRQYTMLHLYYPANRPPQTPRQVSYPIVSSIP